MRPIKWPLNWKLLKQITKKRQAILWLKKLFSLALLVLLAIGFYFLLTGDFFKVQAINCQRKNFPCNKEINFFSELKGQNIFIINTEKVIKDVKGKIPSLKEIKIKKHLPNQINIRLVYRQPLAAICQKSKSCFLTDSEGFIYKKTYSLPPEIPIIEINNLAGITMAKFIKQDYLLKALKVIKELKKNFILFNKIILSSKEEITIFLPESIIASFSAKKSLKAQVDSLQFILRQSKIEGKLPAIIDLRFLKPVIK